MTRRNQHVLNPKMSSKENNPGNFANRPKEELVETARKGGAVSHSGGFASMDAEKQVRYVFYFVAKYYRSN